MGDYNSCGETWKWDGAILLRGYYAEGVEGKHPLETPDKSEINHG